MPWTCEHCGCHRCADDAPSCSACGHRRLGVLVLTSVVTGQALRFAVTARVGRPVLRTIDPDGARYAAIEQFSVEEADAGTWQLRPCKTAPNPLFFDGVPVPEGGVALSPGAVVSIGPTHLRLSVRIDH